MTLLGGYINTVHHQISMLSPAINRLSQLMEREPLMNDPNERRRTIQMATHVGRAIRELIIGLRPLAEILSRLRLGDRPGEFGIDMGNSNSPPTRSNVPTTSGNQQGNRTNRAQREGNQNQGGQQGNSLQDVLGQLLGGGQNQRPGNNQQQQANPLAGLMSMAENLVNNLENQQQRNPQNNQGQEQQPNPLAGLMSMAENLVNNLENQQQGNQTGQQNNSNPLSALLGGLQQQQAPPQNNQQQANPLQGLMGALMNNNNQQGGEGAQNNPIANLLGSLGGMDSGDIFSMTIGEMHERSGMDTEQDFETAVLSPLTVQEMFQLLQGNSDVLDAKHMAMRTSMKDHLLR